MGHKIAIIEDDLAISKMYQLKFESEGFTVKTAANGAAGLALLKSFKADVVLLDIMMPEMNGDEMLAKYRKTTGGKHTKVIILTNIGEQELPKGLQKLDVSSVVAKAYNTPAQIVEKVTEVL